MVAGYCQETSLVILLVGLSKAFEAISDVFHGMIQEHERMDCVAVSLMIKVPLSLVLLGIGVYTGSVVWGAAGLAVAWAIVLISYDIPNGALILGYAQTSPHKRYNKRELMLALRPRWHLKTLTKLAWFALPLGFVTMLFSLYVNIPRYLIERYLGDRLRRVP